MGRNTSISLGNHFENFIQHSIDNGRYTNASEVIRAGLRLLEVEESKVVALRQAINEGRYSGRAINFNPQLHLETIKAGKKSNG